MNYFDQLEKTLRAARGKKSSDFTKEEQKAIVNAANCSNKSLNQLAWLVVDESLKDYQHKIIKRHITNKFNYEDYLNECFIAIMIVC